MAYRSPRTQQFVVDRVVVNDEGCWIWQQHIDRYGYPLIAQGAQERRVHRLSYRLFVGDIPDGMTVDHLCFVTQCVNPEHLQLMTVEDNTRRRPPETSRSRKPIPTWATHGRAECSNGHPWVEENIRLRGMRPICRLCDNEARKRRYHANRA